VPVKLSDAEWTVMNAVWQGHPASVRDVWERVQSETGWAYTTVKTVLERLVEKNALAAQKRANSYLYTPKVSRKDARRSALQSLVAKAFDGTVGSLLHHLVVEEKLTKRDRERLAAMLDDLDRTKAKEARIS
jgi:BlaI family transcriptional regulator, penicillinase repressor